MIEHMLRQPRRLLGIVLIVSAAVVTGHAAELQSRTAVAFDRYVAATEARMAGKRAGDGPFLWVDRQPQAARLDADRRLLAGEVVIDRLRTRDTSGDDIDIPKGMVHHWVGTVLLPGVALDETLAMVQDYDRYAEIYTPNVEQSALLGREGNRFRPSPRPYPSRLPTVEYPAHFETRLMSRNGGFRWACRWVSLSHLLAGQRIGLEEVDDGVWDVYYSYVRLGQMDERTGQVEDALGRRMRNPKV